MKELALKCAESLKEIPEIHLASRKFILSYIKRYIKSLTGKIPSTIFINRVIVTALQMGILNSEQVKPIRKSALKRYVEFKKLLDEGFTYAEIGRRLGITRAAVELIVLRGVAYGVIPFSYISSRVSNVKRHKFNLHQLQPYIPEILNLYKQGMSYNKILQNVAPGILTYKKLLTLLKYIKQTQPQQFSQMLCERLWAKLNNKLSKNSPIIKVGRQELKWLLAQINSLGGTNNDSRMD